MGREVRKVPADWQHPKDEHTGRYKPMFDGRGFAERLREWNEENAKWSSGELSTDFVENSHSHHGVSSSLADCLMTFGTVFKNRPMPSDRAALTRAITAA